MTSSGVKLRVVGDVHGASKAFAAAAETDRFVIQLGDLVDDGPYTARRAAHHVPAAGGKARSVDPRYDDFKLARALRGDNVRGAPTIRTLAELPAELRDRTRETIMAAPAWAMLGPLFFVHGSFHPGMLEEPPPPFPPWPVLARCCTRLIRADHRARDRRRQAGAAAALGGGNPAGPDRVCRALRAQHGWPPLYPHCPQRRHGGVFGHWRLQGRTPFLGGRGPGLKPALAATGIRAFSALRCSRTWSTLRSVLKKSR